MFATDNLRSIARAQKRLFFSLVDQALVSASTVLTGVVLLRQLGLENFGQFSFFNIILQSMASLQIAAVIAPMMTNFQRRGAVSREEYLAVLLVYQLAFAVASASLLILLLPTVSFLELALPGGVTVVTVVISTQLQDFVRRFFFVTERPQIGLISDVLTYGGRLGCFVLLGWHEQLTLVAAWLVIAATSLVGFLTLLIDIPQLKFTASAFVQIGRAHKQLIGWLLGSAIVQWLSGNLYLMLIGVIAGPQTLGAIRAVQNLLGAANVLIQSLENFVPASATRVLLSGGVLALERYLLKVSAAGSGFLVLLLGPALIFLEPIMQIVYGQRFSHQAPLFACFAAFYIFGYIQSVITAGLRSLNLLGNAFFFQVITSLAALPLGWWMTSLYGAVGAGLALLLPRAAIVLRLWTLLLRARHVGRLT